MELTNIVYQFTRATRSKGHRPNNEQLLLMELFLQILTDHDDGREDNLIFKILVGTRTGAFQASAEA